MKRGTIIITCALAALAAGAVAEEVSVEDLLRRAEKTYREMDALEVTGEAVMEMEGGLSFDMRHSFTARLKRPNHYCIAWTTQMPFMGGPARGQVRFAVWNAGDGPYLYFGLLGTYSPMKRDDMAIAAATGISGGAAQQVPALFFPETGLGRSPIRLKDAQLAGTEKLGDQECYVVKGHDMPGEQSTLWISAARHVLLKKVIRWDLQDIEDSQPMTDEEIDEFLEETGQEVTPERRAQVRRTVDDAGDMMKEAQGTLTQTVRYATVKVNPELAVEDLRYKLPEGARLDENPFGGLMNQIDELAASEETEADAESESDAEPESDQQSADE